MRALGLGLALSSLSALSALLALLALLALWTGPASAACRCLCVNGAVRTQCSGPLDPPAICSRICPMPARPQGSPPEVTGFVPPAGSDATLGTGSPALLGATGLDQ